MTDTRWSDDIREAVAHVYSGADLAQREERALDLLDQFDVVEMADTIKRLSGLLGYVDAQNEQARERLARVTDFISRDECAQECATWNPYRDEPAACTCWKSRLTAMLTDA